MFFNPSQIAGLRGWSPLPFDSTIKKKWYKVLPGLLLSSRALRVLHCLLFIMELWFGLLGLALFMLSIGVEGFDPLIQLRRSGNGFRTKWVVSVDDFGAVGDGVSDDTQAFNDAWAAACFLTSETVLQVPEGKTYLVGPINFGEHCSSNLTFLISGTIVAPDDPDAWGDWDRQKWLYFHNLENFRVGGGGIINGMGEKWWAQSCKINKTNPCQHAPAAITFHRCSNLKVQNLMIVNSQQMHVAFTSCSQVHAYNLRVFAPDRSPNTDGIHISASVSVVVKTSIIRTGDDCISIVSGSSGVRIKGVICGPGHGISIGSLGKSNSWAEVYDVQVDGAVLSHTDNGLRIKTWQGGQGFVCGVSFSNVLMKNVSNPIIIDQYYCDSSTPCKNQTDAVNVSGISFTNIKGTSATKDAIKFACSDTHPCQDILLKDFILSSESGGQTTAFCWSAMGRSLGTKNSPPCFTKDGNCIKQEDYQSWLSFPWLDDLFHSLVSV